MEISIKKKLARNWFKVLQDMVCFDIEEIENNKIKFISNHWKKSQTKDEGGGEYKILENGKVFEGQFQEFIYNEKPCYLNLSR